MFKLITCLLLSSSIIATVVDGQGSYRTGNISTSLIAASDLAVECRRPSDCRWNEVCIMPDFDNGMPLFWPICEHYGTCACKEGAVRIENGTCLMIVTLNLKDPCIGRLNERYTVEGSFCNGTHVICNPVLYNEQWGMCVLKPQSTMAPNPILVFVPQTQSTIPPIPSLPPVIVVGPGAACDNVKVVCDSMRGLACINRICKCAVKPNIYDEGVGYCRPRIYADPCQEHEECNSGYFASTGFECRMGRCRCQSGYEPIDQLYFNETTRTTYSKRICIIVGTNTYVPTGGECTMYPERYSDRVSMNLCHKRAFCRPCFRDGKANAFTGICREMSCGSDEECFGHGTNNLRCTRQEHMFDPPCEKGICECNHDTGYFMDRFSRCTPRFQLWLGDRCMIHDTKTDPFSHYTYNEVLPFGSVCETKLNLDTEVRCNLPFLEDYDGNCTNNADWRLYQEECDPNDIKTLCDVSRGLQCRNGRCGCPNMPNFIWDGNICRTKDFGDQCLTSIDCDNKLYYPRVTGTVTCDNGYCVCGRGFSTFDYTFLVYNQIDDSIAVSTRKYCLRTGKFDVIEKGRPCHLSPLSQADADTQASVQVCSPGLVCSRCKAERYPDDDSMGTCRLFTPPQPPTPPAPPVVYITGMPPEPQPQQQQPWGPPGPDPALPVPWGPQPQPWQHPGQPWMQPGGNRWQLREADGTPSPQSINSPRANQPSRTSWGGQWIDSPWADLQPPAAPLVPGQPGWAGWVAPPPPPWGAWGAQPLPPWNAWGGQPSLYQPFYGNSHLAPCSASRNSINNFAIVLTIITLVNIWLATR